MLCIKTIARRGTFLLVPHTRTINQEIIELGRNEHCDFIRVCPLTLDSPEARLNFKLLNFKRAPIHVHPEHAWIVELKDDETLFAGMRKTTRYSIKKAQKDGIVAHISTDLEAFWKLYILTAQRQQFVPFSRKLLEAEFQAFGDDAFIVMTDHASAFVVTTEDEAFYHHGASTHHPTASYLVQWTAMQEARRRGKKFYNFWGVWDDPHSPQYGLSQFKRGFGGFQESYVPTQDFILTKKYWLNYIIEKIRKLQRGF
ncbi:MAG: peptidoglycan bridge formation glycyltransferase FemA/FemB family protein [Patescibacteria group bacterium]